MACSQGFLGKPFLVVLRNSLSSMLVILVKKQGEPKKKKKIPNMFD